MRPENAVVAHRLGVPVNKMSKSRNCFQTMPVRRISIETRRKRTLNIFELQILNLKLQSYSDFRRCSDELPNIPEFVVFLCVHKTSLLEVYHRTSTIESGCCRQRYRRLRLQRAPSSRTSDGAASSEKEEIIYQHFLALILFSGKLAECLNDPHKEANLKLIGTFR